MKRVITTSVVAGLLGALGYAPVASAEGTLYGSVRSGIIVKDDGESDAMWDLGSVDGGDLGDSGDRLWSRIGVKASHELDNGMMAGLHIEKRLDQFRTRHQNVWLGGDMGRITLGQQGSPYHSAVGWDGTNFTGGNFAMAVRCRRRLRGAPASRVSRSRATLVARSTSRLCSWTTPRTGRDTAKAWTDSRFQAASLRAA